MLPQGGGIEQFFVSGFPRGRVLPFHLSMRLFRLLILLCLSSLLVSCSTPETRSKERSDSFSRLSKADQRLVLEGRITEGLSQDAVYIAMGHPYKQRRGRFEGKDTQSWIYGRLEGYTIPRYRYEHYRDASGRVYSTPVYDPVTEYRTVETFAVFFDQGRVVGWQEL
jgi:hypothetical protein